MPYRTWASAQLLGDVLLPKARLVQRNQLSGLTVAEPRMAYPLASLTDQSKDAALGEPILPAKF